MTSTLSTRPLAGNGQNGRTTCRAHSAPVSGGSTARRVVRRVHAVALVVIATALALASGATDSAAAAGASVLAPGPVDRLIQSTGNLYWTTSFRNEVGPSTASVYRASKFNTPGAERLLYQETATGYFYFGDITYANPGTWYGYFVANYVAPTRVSKIKRVPLAGGAAVTLATSPAYVGLRDLDTDGSFLYWADEGGLRRMPVGGGAVTTLVIDPTIGSVGLDATRVFYSVGREIRSVSKPPLRGPGSAALPRQRTHVVAQSTITSMHVHGGSGTPVFYWGEENGSVKSAPLSGGGVSVITVYQGPVAGRRTWSVFFDGARVLWTDCEYPNGNGCRVRKRQGTTTTIVASGVGAGNVQGDAEAMFWSAGALVKYVH